MSPRRPAFHKATPFHGIVQIAKAKIHHKLALAKVFRAFTSIRPDVNISFMRFLGIDYGTKNIGLALSDEGGRFSYPYRVIPNTGRAAMMVAEICEQEGVDSIVIGDSKDLKGNPNLLATEIASFKDQVETVTDLTVNLEPEVYTTAEASRVIGKDEDTDARAAALILKSYLDRQS